MAKEKTARRRRRRDRSALGADIGRIASGIAAVASALGHGSTDRAGDNLQQVVKSLDRAGRDLKRLVKDTDLGAVGRGAKAAAGAVGTAGVVRAMGSRPMATALAAFGAGVLVGSLLQNYWEPADEEDEYDEDEDEDGEDDEE